MLLGPATRTVEIMRSPSPTLDELRRDLEHLVMDLVEGDRRGAIPARCKPEKLPLGVVTANDLATAGIRDG
jgi:hypothetical protein